MTQFDPYLKWLGIRDPLRPPHHYRLLGIDPFESDPDVIKSAANRQINFVSSFVGGEHSAQATELVERLKYVANVLLNAQKKQLYDDALRPFIAQLNQAASQSGIAGTPQQTNPDQQHPGQAAHPQPVHQQTASPVVTANKPHSPGIQSRPTQKKKDRGLMTAIGVITGGIAAVATAALIIKSGWLANIDGNGDPAETVARNDENGSPGTGESRGSTALPDENKIAEANDHVNRFDGASDSDHGNGHANDDPGDNLLNPAGHANSGNSNSGNAESEPDGESGNSSGGFFESGSNTGEFTLDQPAPDGQLTFGDGTGPDATTGNDPNQPEIEPVRKPVPTDAELTLARELVSDLFSEVYDRATPEDRRTTLLRKMLKDVENSTEVANVFTLLSETATIASESGQPELCHNAMEELNLRFEIDYFELTESLFIGMQKRINAPEQLLELSSALTTMSLKGLTDGQYEYAKTMSDAGVTIAKKINPATLRFTEQLKDEIAEARKIADKGLKAASGLEASPDDKKSNESLGDFLCLIKNDHKAGCEHWLKSGDKELVLIARAELEAESGLHDKLKIAADAWYAAAEITKDEFRRNRMLARASTLYSDALSGLPGLTKEFAQNRVDEIETFLMDAPTASAFANTPSNLTTKNALTFLWVIQVDGGGSFDVRFNAGKALIRRSGKTANLDYSENNQMFLVSLAPREDSTLMFRIRAVNKIDYKKVDHTTGATSEWGGGGRRGR